jgi:predicted nucleotidyltransferase component of viral defense system
VESSPGGEVLTADGKPAINWRPSTPHEAPPSPGIIALYNRGEGKDMYDVFYALEEKIDRAAFDQALTFMGEQYRINMESFPGDLIDKLHALRKNAIYIGNSTNHFIPRQRRPDWRTFIDSLIQNIEGFFS